MAQTLRTESVSRQAVLRRIDALAIKLRRRQLIGSREVSLEVIRLLREIVSGAKFSSFKQLVDHLEEVGRILQDAGPKELVVTNMTRRTITLISEEYATALTNFLNDSASSSTGTASPRHVPETPALGGDATATSFFTASDLAGRTPHSGALGSLFDLLGHRSSAQGPSGGFAAASPTTGVSPALSSPASPSSPSGSSPFVQSHSALPLRTPSLVSPHVQAILSEEFSRRSFSLKPVFIEAIAELMDEVEMTYRSVGEQSIDHIHSGEFILTIGHSNTVEAFLKNASRKRKFTVIVAESAPSYSGRLLATSLSSSGIPTILIPDSNIVALLPRCSKVLLGPHLVLADGTLLSIVGSLPLATAAKALRVPVVIVGGMYKFCPVYLGEAGEWGMRDLGSPDQVLLERSVTTIPTWTGAAEEAGRGGGGRGGGHEPEPDTEVLNPFYDVVPAELVSLYITNLGGHPSSLLYRLLSETYGSGSS